MKIIKNIVFYIGGLFLVTIGINLSKMTRLGISPVTSIPRACEVIWGKTLGVSSVFVFLVLVLLQAVILRKRFKLRNVLGIALSLGFGLMVDFTGTDPKAFGHLLYGFPEPKTYIMRLVYILIGIVIISIGLYMYLKPHWIPMPSEGLAEAIATVSGKSFGDCKTLVDTSMIVIALIMQLVFLGGLSSFTGPDIIVREGTVLASLLVGQCVKLLRYLIEKNSGTAEAAAEN